MKIRLLLGYIALALAVLGIGLFLYDAFVERDGAVDYSSLLIGFAALVGAIAVLRKYRSDERHGGE